MFNLSMKQVHNLLRSTYCHWPGLAITWNCCFGNQLIWAMTWGGRGWWYRWEEKAGRGYPVGRQCSFPPLYWAIWVLAAAPGAGSPREEVQPASSTAAICIAGWPWFCTSHQEQKLFFLPRHPRSTVTGSSWDCPPKSMKLPTTSPLLFPAPSAGTFAEESLAHNWQIFWPCAKEPSAWQDVWKPHAVLSQQESLGRKTYGGKGRRGKSYTGN